MAEGIKARKVQMAVLSQVAVRGCSRQYLRQEVRQAIRGLPPWRLAEIVDQMIREGVLMVEGPKGEMICRGANFPKGSELAWVLGVAHYG
jgi:hypothetical protein